MNFLILLLMMTSLNCVQVPQYTSGEDTTVQYNSGHVLQTSTTASRYVDCPVSFSFTFTYSPQIMFAISYLDMDGTVNGYSAVAQSISTTGFVIRYKAYTTSLIYSIRSFWYALLDDMVTVQTAIVPQASFSNYVITFATLQTSAPVAVIFMNGLQFSVKTSFVYTLGIPTATQVALTITVSNGSVISQAMFNIIYAQSTYISGGIRSMTTLTSVTLLTIDGYIKFQGQGLSGYYTTNSVTRIKGVSTISGSSYSVQYSSWSGSTIINYQISYFGYKPCAKYCVSCLTTGPTYCTACIASTQRNTDPLCTTCNYGYYMPSNEQGCISCPTNCDGCLSPTGDCLNCLASTQRINPPLCTDCQSNYYAQIGNIICQQCSSNCYECVTTSTQCTTCYPLSYRSVDTNLKCSCMTGYFEQDNQCQQCDVSCQACSGPYFECTMCQQTCNQCQVGRCQCDKGYYINVFHECESFCGDQIVVGNEQCDDGNQDPFDGCFQCQYTCNAHCDVCANNICMNCQSGYYLSTINQCESICGDGIIAAYEQCDDQLLIDYIQCYNCKLICDINCIECRYGRCIQCQIGYSINNFNQCQTICGDLIVLGQEQCDDGNLIPQNGCWNCQFDCPINCYTCTLGQCTECNSGYYTQYSNKCNSFCGDGIIAGNELCDDGNSIFFDGCYTCNWSCIDHCLTCFNGVCQNCQSGYYLFNQQCYSICGDNIVTNDEFCDDGNSYPFDNCHQCQRSCSQYCLNCSDGFCLSCQNGYYVNDNLCTTQCGDMIIAGSEQCDDGNFDMYDGCYTCIIGCPYATFLYNNRCNNICGDGLVAIDLEQCDDGNQIMRDGCSSCVVDNNYVCYNINSPSLCYKCPLYCNVCQIGICLSCRSGYFLQYGNCVRCDLQCRTCKNNPSSCIIFNPAICDIKYGLYPNYITESCYSICGDAIKAESEQCDDGNVLSGDGCNNSCLVEKGWKCDNINPSYCDKQILPTLQINLKQQPNLLFQQLLVELSFRCYLYDNKNTSLNILSSEYNIEIFQAAQFNSTNLEMQTISYLVTLQPLQDIKNLLIQIFLPNNTYKTNQQLILGNITNQIILLNLYYITPTVQTVINQVSNFNNYLIYAIIGVGILSFAIGSLEPILNVLDLMQYLSYLQYIDIPFPYILTTYFNIFNIVSMDLIIKSLGLTNIDTYPMVKTTHKFEYYEINAYFLANIQSFIFILSSSYLIYFLLKFLGTMIYSHQNFLNHYLFLKAQLYVMRLISTTNNFHCSGIVQLILSSFYDLSFAYLLFLKYQSLESYPDYLYLAMTFIIIVTFIKIMNQAALTSQSLRFHRKLKCLLEGVRNNQNVYVKGLTFYQIIKKTIFCVLIVSLQGYGEVQTVLVSMNSIIFICYFSYFRPLVNNLEHIKIVITEIIICISTLTFLIYSSAEDHNIIQVFEWMNVFSLSLAIFVSLLIDSYQVGAKSYPHMMNLIKNIQNNQATHNPLKSL